MLFETYYSYVFCLFLSFYVLKLENIICLTQFLFTKQLIIECEVFFFTEQLAKHLKFCLLLFFVLKSYVTDMFSDS